MAKNNDLENRLAREIESSTPDVWLQLLSRLKQEGADDKMSDTATLNMTGVIENKPARPAKKSLGKIARAVAAMAAVLTVAFGAYVGYGYFAPDATIGFDVNPSIKLEVNKNEKILSATPLNDDARTVLEDMNLKNVDLNVGVNALIGSMVKNGYISELKNSILITVDSSNPEKSLALQKRLAGEVNSLLDAYSVPGAVLSQTVSEDDKLTSLALQHGISVGKAALIDMLVAQDDTLTFEGLAPLSINDINLLMSSRQATPKTVEAKGQASSGEYIGEEKAKQAALSHAGVDAASLTRMKIDLDFDDGRMIYDVEFISGNIEYEYEIDALTGAVLEFDRDVKYTSPVKQPVTPPTTQPPATQPISPPATQPPAQVFIGLAKAKSIALTHAGFSESDVKIAKQTSYEKDGKTYYNIIFSTSSAKYTYLIDAVSGAILENYINNFNDHHDDDDKIPSGNYIGSEKAGSIALTHAGAAKSNVTDFEVKLDEDDGKIIYEVDFDFSGMEYEYEIDAFTGDILHWESERD